MKTINNKTILDIAIEEMHAENNAAINTNFLQEWEPFDKLNKLAERKITNHFINHSYQFQSTHEESSKKPFKVYTFKQLENILGIVYTSSSDYAGLWVTNSGYLWATPTHYFIGFAINTDNEVIAIAWDKDENEIYIKM